MLLSARSIIGWKKMIIVENANGKNIIENILSKEILSLNPVLAGGFIVGIYYLAIRYSSPIYDRDLKVKLERSLETGVLSRKSKTPIAARLKDLFSDIDCWFLEDNSIWNGNELTPLISDFEPDKEEEEDKDGKRKVLWSSNSDRQKKYYDNANKEYKSFLLTLGLGLITSSTYWANSFLTHYGAYRVQFIKRKYKDIDDLFSNFDIVNCCAAYYDGKFYFHDDFLSCSEESVLEAGKKFFKPTILSQIWTAQRCFKYQHRHDLEFSPKVCEQITDLFLNLEPLDREVEVLRKKGKKEIDLGDIEDFHDPYGRNKGIVDIMKLQGMINDLYSEFGQLIRMKYFDENKALLFLGTKKVNHLLEKYFNDFKAKNPAVINKPSPLWED